MRPSARPWNTYRRTNSLWYSYVRVAKSSSRCWRVASGSTAQTMSEYGLDAIHYGPVTEDYQ